MNRKVYTSKEEFLSQRDEAGLKLPYSDDVSVLAKQDEICGKKIHNRLVCQAMEGCDGTKDGRPDELTIRRYQRLAEGGAGIIWFEATAVMPEARANPRQLYINDANLDDFKREVEKIKEDGMKKNGFAPVVIMQATHSGRYSKPEGKPAPIIAYNNPIFEKDNPISKDRIVTDDYLDRVGEALVKGSVLAEKAGFDGVDIKCCHRYLNCELLSAFTREGRYGGESVENRTRLLRESVDGAIKSCDSNFIVTTRLNAYDGFVYPYGFGVRNDGSLDFEPKEPIWLLGKLKESGVKLVNITMGNPYFNPHVNRPFANGPYEDAEHPLAGVERMLEGTAVLKNAHPELKIICSALSFLGTVSPNVVSSYISENKFDYAGYGRTIFAYPEFANDIVNKGELDKNNICIACSKCTEIMRAGSTPGCVIRDKDVYMPLYKEYCMKK